MYIDAYIEQQQREYDLIFFKKCVCTMPIPPLWFAKEVRETELRHLQGLSTTIGFTSILFQLEVDFETKKIVITEIEPTCIEGHFPLLDTSAFSLMIIRNTSSPEKVIDVLSYLSEQYDRLNPPIFNIYDEHSHAGTLNENRRAENEASRARHREFMISQGMHITFT